MPAQKWTHPGERRRCITIQQQNAAVRTGMGFLSNTWADVLTTWAQVSTKLVIKFAETKSDVPLTAAIFLINIRYVPGVTLLRGMRVQDEGNYYLIQDIMDIEERHRELTLYCSQIPAPAAQEQ